MDINIVDKIKLGCVGLNRGLSLLSDVAADERVTITAICDRDITRLYNAADKLSSLGHCPAKFTNYADFLCSDADAVVIATELSAHIPMTVQALDAGRHVLSEIPAMDCVGDARRLTDAVNSHPKQKYMIAENCCYWDFIREYKRLYDAGTLGDVFYMEAEYLHNVVALMQNPDGTPTWRAYLDAIKYLTHDLGPLLYITGDRCVSVSAFAPKIDATDGISKAHADEVAVFKTEKGALIKILTSFGLTREYRHNFTLYGTKATVERDRRNETSHLWTGDGYTALEIGEGRGGAHGGADAAMLSAFIDCIERDEKPPLDVNFACDISIPGIIAAASANADGIQLPIETVR